MINKLLSNQSLKFFESRSVIYLSVSISSCKEQAKSMYILIKIVHCQQYSENSNLKTYSIVCFSMSLSF